jgi:AraC-like DNA-binding protein
MASQAPDASQFRENSQTAENPSGTIAGERHYTVAEIAERWNLSRDAVRRLFRDEPGVLILGNHFSARKRQYTTLRIPESVLERVHRGLSFG